MQTPNSIKKALSMMILVTGIGAFKSADGNGVRIQDYSQLQIYISILILLGIFFFHWYFIKKRRNWARWSYSILISFILLFLSQSNLNSFSGFLVMIQQIIYIAIIIFLFLPESSLWFKKSSQTKTASSIDGD